VEWITLYQEVKIMKQGHFEEHWVDHSDALKSDGAHIKKLVPSGGVATGRGFTISWQHGPLGRGNDRKEPNGAFVEDVIAACISRIEFYQQHFPCQENVDALEGLEYAAARLDERTKDRELRQVEGVHLA
jgi:hypothetical protein